MAKDDIVDVEAGDAPTSDPLVTGLVVFTTIALLVGLITIAKALGSNYGRGFLAD
jgi:hypothetical protein